MSVKPRFYLCIFVLLLIISGCSNPYSKFYQDFTEGKDLLANGTIVTPPDTPHITKGTKIELDERKMAENGYICLGYSSFNGANVEQNAAIRQAKKVRADTVIVYYEYTNTVSGAMPLTTPNTQTSYHSGNIYGSGGSASYFGSSTTHGSTTTYMPYNIRRYDYFASYWAKLKRIRFGVWYTDLTDELKKQIGSNKGVKVNAVVKNSPAVNSDILYGDIIRKANGVEIVDPSHFDKIIHNEQISELEIEIFRQGKTITKKAKLNP